jgi:hypothetical protein
LRLNYKETVIFLVLLYNLETSSVTIREEHRQEMFMNWLLRRIFGSKGDEITGS